MKEIENTNIELELNQMKEQLRELKRIVESKELINQNLMRQVMADKAKWIRQYNKIQLFVLLPFIYLSFLFLQHFLGLSWLFYWSTALLCTASILVDMHVNRLSEKDYMSMSLLDLMTSLVKRQKYRRIQLVVGLPVATLWCIWYVMEIRDVESAFDFSGTWIGGVIGGIIGGIIAYLIVDKAQRIDADAVRDIRNMMGE